MPTSKDYATARQDPSAVFDRPEDVLYRDDWSRQQKIEVLRRWEYDAAEQAVAEEEGMPGTRSTPSIRDILRVLDTLGARGDPGRSAAHKQHGL